MRTTLEIDDEVLAFARDRARAERSSLGRIVSELAAVGVAANSVTGIGHGLVQQDDGLVTVAPGIGRRVTDQQVADALDRLDSQAGFDD